MELNKILDKAIKLSETGTENPSEGYKIGSGEPYSDYMSKSLWEAFCKEMEEFYPKAYNSYKNGGGKELEERKVKGNTYPPKMASYGSSSRFIYNLMKNDENFEFEVKLPTTVGGIANLDGFRKIENGYVFVEAKCREPYGAKTKVVETKYKEFYEYINQSAKTKVFCDMVSVDGKKEKMKVTFKYDEKEIEFFDMKQMISHLLGIATAFLTGKYQNGNIHFMYLLFNPTKISIPDPKAETKINNIYNSICDVCKMIDFKSLFEVILEYLQKEKGLGKDKCIADIIHKFTFDLCDQDSFEGKIG